MKSTKKNFPDKYRFHIFVMLKIISIKNNVATVIYDNCKQNIILQNMDALFYFNETMIKIQENRIKFFSTLTSIM